MNKRLIYFLAIVFLLLLWFFGFARTFRTLDAKPSQLSANELANVLGVHWWIVKLPDHLGAKDMVGAVFVDSTGKIIQGGGGFSGGPWKLGDKIKVFIREDANRDLMTIAMVAEDGTTGTTPFKDFFKNAATGGPGNGSVLKIDDILLKFDSSQHPSMSGGNVLQPGQIGVKIGITRKN